MTAIPAPITLSTSAPADRSWLGSRAHDVVVLTRRNLMHIRREPLQLSDVTIQPVLFTLLFVYVFGSGVPVAGGYKQFAIAGLIVFNLTTAAMGTAVGLVSDLTTGAIDRFRTLPMWRSAVLVGRSMADLLTACMAVGIVTLTGLCIGWRAHTSAGSIIAGFAVALLFAYALSWCCACLGIVSKGAEAAQGVGLVILFPLAIVSNAMVPTTHMPAWLRDIANWNPVSAVCAAVRHLFGNPNPAGAVQAWPMQHPVLAAVIWSVALLAIAAPFAAYLFRKRVTG